MKQCSGNERSFWRLFSYELPTPTRVIFTRNQELVVESDPGSIHSLELTPAVWCGRRNVGETLEILSIPSLCKSIKGNIRTPEETIHSSAKLPVFTSSTPFIAKTRPQHR